MDPLVASEPSNVLLLSDWKARALAGDDLSEFATRKQYVVEFKAVDGDERGVGTVISTEVRDRDSDTISAKGWDLKAYRKNPVVLWAHDYRSLPIAKSTSISASDGQLRSVDHFVEEEILPLAETIFQMVKHKYINAKSVGFNPSKWEVNEDEGGFDFTKQELLEHSYVPVPSNPEALVQARGMGIDLSPLKDWCEAMLDNWGKANGIWVRRGQMEEMVKLLSTAVTVSVPEPVNDAVEDKGPISYKLAHDAGTALAKVDEPWDGEAEVAVAGTSDLMAMSCWFGDGEFKLVHHKAWGNYEVVYLGVLEAAARLPGSVESEAEQLVIKDHLGKHYREFADIAPWDDSPTRWAVYEAGCKAILKDGGPLDDDDRASLLIALGFEQEFAALADEVKSAAPADVKAEVEDLLMSLKAPEKQTIVAGVSNEDMKDILTEALSAAINEAARTALAVRTGRLD